MIRTAFALVICASMFVLFACNSIAGPQTVGSGVAKSETRQIDAPFTGVRTSGGGNVIITIGEQPSVVVETDDNILPLIITRVAGGVLEITSDQSYSTRLGVKVTITMPELKSAQVNGSGDITANGIKTGEFSVQVRGSGNVKLEGTCDSLNVEVSGSGDVDTTKMQAADAKVQIRGSGDVKVNASKSLDAQITGSGDIRYAGNPGNVQQQITGSGSVKPL